MTDNFTEPLRTILFKVYKVQDNIIEMQLDYSKLEKTINKIFQKILCNLSFCQ